MTDVAASNAAELIQIGQLEIRYLQEGNASLAMGCFELRVPPGSNVPPPHAHGANEELVVVLEGCLRFTVGAVTRDLSVGDSMGTPAGVVHGFSNPHSATARALVINTPGIGAQYFREMAAIVSKPGPPDRAQMLATMERFGLVAAPPKPAPAAPV